MCAHEVAGIGCQMSAGSDGRREGRGVRPALAGALVTVALAAWIAPSASAAVYCVDVASTTGCSHVESPGGSTGLAAAFSSANGSSGADTIEIGAGTYTGPFAATAAGGALSVIGAGSTGSAVTTLTVTGGNQTVLKLAVSGSSVSHARLELPNRTGDTGLGLNGAATDVRVDDPAGSTQAIGVDMNHPDSFTGTISLANGASSIAINRTADGTGAETVSSSSISASQAVLATSGNWLFDHDQVIASDHGVQALDGSTQPAVVSISDSLVKVTTTNPSTCGPVACFGFGVSGSSSITADRVTLVGTGQAFPGGYVLGAVAGKTATLQIRSTVLTGFSPALRCAQSSGGSAKLTATYSDFPTPVATAGGCAAPAPGHNLSAAPGFAPGGSVPQWNSPLIDAGDPGTLFLRRNPTDLNGNARLVDGNGDGTTVVDIGAYEYQRLPPSVTGKTVAKARVGSNVPFAVTQASDPDPGDKLTYSWNFDDGGTAAGARVTHAFTTTGVHRATVTATDPTGLTATSTVSVDIVAKQTQLPPPPTPKPKISGLKQSHKTWREGSKLATVARRHPRPPVGTTFSFTLNTAASLKLTFSHSVSGRRTGKKCAAPSRANRHHRSCTRSISSGSVSLKRGPKGKVRIVFQGRLSRHKKLRPGRYTVTITATNAKGRTTSHALTFAIVAG